MIQVIDNFNYKGEKSNFARDQFSTYQDMQNFPDYHLDESYLSSYKLLTAKSSKSLNFPNKLIGALFFDGWSGKSGYTLGNESLFPNSSLPDKENYTDWREYAKDHDVELISKNAYPPADCSFSMFYPNEALEKYPDRKSYLGWVINTKQQMEKQIELASSHGIDYFMFCFYIPSNIKEAIDNEGNIAFDVIESSSYNNAIYKFLEAENNYKMKFCIMLCDHGNRLNEKTLHQMLSYINTKFVQHNQYLYMNGRAVVSFFDLSFADKVKNCHKINNSLLLLNTFNPIHGGFNGRMSYAGAIPNNIGLYSYETLSTFNVGKINSTYKLIPSLLDIPTVAVGRNEFPRADFITKNQSNNYAFLDPTKQQFLDQLKNVIDILPDFSTEDQSILIYAWNELGEGGFLLPTRGLTTTEANDYPLLGDDMQQEFNDENKALYYDLYKLQAVKEVKEYWNSK